MFPWWPRSPPDSPAWVEFLTARRDKARAGDLIAIHIGDTMRYAMITGFDRTTRTWSAQLDPDTHPTGGPHGT